MNKIWKQKQREKRRKELLIISQVKYKLHDACEDGDLELVKILYK